MSKNILIIEDDADTQLLFTEILEIEGYQVVAHSDGKHALEYLKQNDAPSLIFMDLNFPNGTPEEFVGELRQIPGAEATPVVLVSGKADIADYQKRLGAVSFVKKPFEIDPLLSLIQDIT